MLTKFEYWDASIAAIRPWEQVDELDNEGVIHLVDALKGKEPNITPLRFTGAQDKNERDIYEKYVLKASNGAVGVVVWSHGDCSFSMQWQGNYILESIYLDYVENYEIIGCVYEEKFAHLREVYG